MDCCNHGDALSVEEALAKMLEGVTPPGSIEEVPLAEVAGRILARDIFSQWDLPQWDNSAMDGYALRHADLAGGQPIPVSQRITAGEPARPLKEQTAARIFTGAMLPPGADSVVMQEQCTTTPAGIQVTGEVNPGDHIRRRGEVAAAGDIILQSGELVTPAALALAASVGHTELACYRQLRVAILATGNELVDPGTRPGPGEIVNSNQPMLAALCRAAGHRVVRLAQVRDDLTATIAALEELAAAADIIVTSGGVSVGEEDHLRTAIEQIGEIDLWRVRMKPGKPVAFGRVGKTPLIALPGNPVSSHVTWMLFGHPLLRKMAGASWRAPVALQVAAGFSIEKPPSRREFIRVTLINNEEGPRLLPHRHQGSAALTGLVAADGLADLAAGKRVREGELLPYLPFSQLLS
jgi:molybdopterin molybdotransferase